MKPIERYPGLDVHKDSTTMAIAEPGPPGEIRRFGTVSSNIDRLEKALRRIGQAHPNARLQVAYEAGPCGFVIVRRHRLQRLVRFPEPRRGGTIIARHHWRDIQTERDRAVRWLRWLSRAVI